MGKKFIHKNSNGDFFISENRTPEPGNFFVIATPDYHRLDYTLLNNDLRISWWPNSASFMFHDQRIKKIANASIHEVLEHLQYYKTLSNAELEKMIPKSEE